MSEINARTLPTDHSKACTKGAGGRHTWDMYLDKLVNKYALYVRVIVMLVPIKYC